MQSRGSAPAHARSPYRGADRRYPPGQIGGPRRLVVPGTLAVLGAAVACSSALWAPWPPGAVTAVADGGRVLLVAVTAAGGALALVEWRLYGRARSALLGVALLGLSLVTAANLVVLLDASVATALDAAWLWIRTGAVNLVVVLLGALVIAPQVDVRLRPARVAVLAVVLAIAWSGLLVLEGALLTPGAHDRHPLGRAALLMAVAFGLGRRVRNEACETSSAAVPLVVALAVLYALSAARGLGDEIAMAIALPGVVLAACWAALVLVATLHVRHRDARERLLDLLMRREAAEARNAADSTLSRRRVHDARSALTAVEGAAATLEHYGDRLDEPTRKRLRAALTSQVTRLHTLVGGSSRVGPTARSRCGSSCTRSPRAPPRPAIGGSRSTRSCGWSATPRTPRRSHSCWWTGARSTSVHSESADVR